MIRGSEPIAATRWLARLVDLVPIARLGADPEGVHQVRVATARLRVWLALGGWHVLVDDLQWLRRHAERVRDLDVHLARRPPADVAEQLLRKHALARDELRAALDSARTAGLTRALSYLPPIARTAAAPRMANMARVVLHRFRVAAAEPHQMAALHRARRALRRLRYSLDWIDACPKEIVALQDALGEAADCGAALRHLDGADSDGSRAYHRQLEDELEHHARSARRMWRRVKPRCEELSRWTCS